METLQTDVVIVGAGPGGLAAAHAITAAAPNLKVSAEQDCQCVPLQWFLYSCTTISVISLNLLIVVAHSVSIGSAGGSV